MRRKKSYSVVTGRGEVKLTAVKKTLEGPVTRVFGTAGKINTNKIMDRLRGGKK